MMLVICIISIMSKAFIYDFYPVIRIESRGLVTGAGLLVYAVLAFMPSILEIWSKLRWKYFISKI